MEFTIYNIVCFSLFYLFFSILIYGRLFAHEQKKWTILAKKYYKKDILFCLFFAIFWPITIWAPLFDGAFGWGFKLY